MPKQELLLRNPITNYPGSLGFYPDFKRLPELKHLGAFFTNSISRHSRQPAADRYAKLHYGTLVLHSGNPNLGIRQVIRSSASRWADSPIPIIPHVWISAFPDLHEIVEMLENLPGISAISIAFSPDLPEQTVIEQIHRIQCELPIMLQVSPTSLAGYSNLLHGSTVSGLTMAANRGIPPEAGRKPPSGRLFGPSQIMNTLQIIRDIPPTTIQLLASGGIFSVDHVAACLAAGANAVQLDTAFWNGSAAAILEEFSQTRIKLPE